MWFVCFEENSLILSSFSFNYSPLLLFILITGEDGMDDDYDSINEEFNLKLDWFPLEKLSIIFPSYFYIAVWTSWYISCSNTLLSLEISTYYAKLDLFSSKLSFLTFSSLSLLQYSEYNSMCS